MTNLTDATTDELGTPDVSPPAPTLKLQAFWFFAGLIGATGSGWLFSREAFDAVDHNCSGMLCSANDLTKACLIFVAGYLGGGVATGEVAKFANKNADDSYSRRRYALKGVALIPACITLGLALAFLALITLT